MDGSTENPDTEIRSRHWTEDRLHADVQRAVGGILNLAREAARISEKLDPSISAEWIIKRLKFLSYELQPHCPMSANAQERLACLNKFLFEDKGFRSLSDIGVVASPSEALRLGSVLSERIGAPLALELVYSFLADSIGIALDFVDLKPTCFLRWRGDGRSRFIDLSRQGRMLSNDELIETLHSRFRMTEFSNAGVLEAFTFENFIADYICALKCKHDLEGDAEKLLFLQDALIAYRPSDLHLVGERAILHRRLGNLKPALSDLKRYFAFHDRSRAPREFTALYDELLGV
jgi:regulator of sirC expression with transglutaminase-like and TPR domain